MMYAVSLKTNQKKKKSLKKTISLTLVYFIPAENSLAEDRVWEEGRSAHQQTVGVMETENHLMYQVLLGGRMAAHKLAF